MNQRDSGQIISSAAEVYEQFFVPALFGPWASRLVSLAGLRADMKVVDVACGTGTLAIEAAKAVRPGGEVVGIDINPAMLSVARRKSNAVEWVEAPAESLPFAPSSFDAVLSQFGLMFFRDQTGAVAEMWRVLAPGGRLAIAVWDSLDNAPGYAAVVALLERLFGHAIANALRAPYALGDSSVLRALLSDAGVDAPTISRAAGTARFPSIRSWMHTDVRGWTLADKLDDAAYERLASEAETELSRFVTEDGSVKFEHPALLATAVKP
jgi:ubiquinone/menaquinone biosynthesis C-methylase UbiE